MKGQQQRLSSGFADKFQRGNYLLKDPRRKNKVSVNLCHNSLHKSDKDWGSCRHPIFAHLQRGRSTIYIKSNRCEELINTRSLDFESSKSDHRRRNNRGLKFGQIGYFSKTYRDYISSFWMLEQTFFMIE